MKHLLLTSVFLALVFACHGQQAAPTALKSWHGGELHEFKMGSRPAKLVYPKKEAPGRPWIWRTEFFGHEPQADAALLAKGWHVAYVDVQNMYGSPAAVKVMDEFYHHMTQGRGLSPQVVLEGFSRGGLFSLGWGIQNPTKVSSIYNDAPVCDFLTWPAGQRGGARSDADWQRLLKIWELTEEQALQGKHSPIHNLAPLAKAKVPLLHVCGDADEAVPFLENTRKLEAAYQALGGTIQVISKPGVKHHPHSLKDPQPIVDFILSHFKPKNLALAANTQNPDQIDPTLPNVLLIGDSISMGYTPFVRKSLAGKANVYRVPTNGGPTTKGVEFLTDWLAERKWQLIHFNFGLHDLKHVAADAKNDNIVDATSPGARIQVALQDYRRNLEQMVPAMKATGAQLLWAETTPVPAGAKGRLPAAVAEYNAAAAEVMKQHNIPTIPLHATAAARPELQRPKDVHFTDAGSEHLAGTVATGILEALKSPAAK